MNNDFLSLVRRFGNDFHSWLRHLWKSLPNRLTRDKKSLFTVTHALFFMTFYVSVYVNNVRYKSISIFLQTIQHIRILTLYALNFSEGKKYIFKSYVIPPNWHVLIQFTSAAPLIFSIDFWLQWQVVAPYPWQLPGQSHVCGITNTGVDFFKGHIWLPQLGNVISLLMYRVHYHLHNQKVW